MNSPVYRFEVSTSHLDGFLSALVLGTLEAMRAGLWPLDAGVWSLGRPAFRAPLERAGIPAPIAAALREADELSAVARLAGRAAADAQLDHLIEGLRAYLTQSTTQPWYATVVKWGNDHECG